MDFHKWRVAALATALLVTLPAPGKAQSPNGMPDQAAASFDGELEVFIREDLRTGNSSFDYFMRPGNGRAPVQLFFRNPPPASWTSGDRIAGQGRSVNGGISVESADVTSSDQPAFTLDERKTLVIIVNATDKAHSAQEIAAMPGYYANNTLSMKALYDEVSFGQLNINLDVDNADGDGRAEPDGIADVFGPFAPVTSEANFCANPFTYAHSILNTAKAQGVDYELYQHRIFALPRTFSCGWVGYASVGCGSTCNAFNIWNHDPATTGHEFGHNAGMAHAGDDPDNNGSINNAYNDRSSFMGYAIGYGGGSTGTLVRGLDGAHHWQMGWYDQLDGASTEVVTASGQKVISPIGTDPRNTSNPTLLRINVGSGDPYILSARKAEGMDAQLATYSSGKYVTGVAIHRYAGTSGYNPTRIIDTLVNGETFTDSTNGLTIQQLSRNSSTGEVTIQITMGSQPCATATPTVSATPSSVLASSNTAYKFGVRVTNRDGAGCPPQTFSLSATRGSLSSSSVTNLAPGATSATVDLTLTGAANGTTSSTVTATGNSGAGSDSVSLTTDGIAPSNPSGLTVTMNKKGNGTFSWTASSDANGIDAYETVIGGQTRTTSSTSLSFSGGRNGDVFSVTAIDNVGLRSARISCTLGANDSTACAGGKKGGGNGGGRGSNSAKK